MIYRIKYANDTWDLYERPNIGDVLVLSTDNKCYYMRVCRHMDSESICASCAGRSILRRHHMSCDTRADCCLCGVGAQNLQPYDILEEL